MIERAKAYIEGVSNGSIPTGKYIRLAIERHYNDLRRQGAPDFPYYFDEAEAARVLDLYKYFRFSKGNVTGEPFDLMPWFAAIVYLAFGWRRPGGGKRFRKVYCKVARGNAKTANLVAVGTIGFLFDRVTDPEVIWVATKKDQARIGWDRQRKMLQYLVQDVPELGSFLRIPKGQSATTNKITRTDEVISWVTYLGRDSSTEDGGSPSMVLVDEYHAWDSDDMMNVMESGQVKVEDPSTWIITTAGYKPNGPNTQFLKSCKNTLNGIVQNDELLAFIYELDKDDDWRNPEVWFKANPGLGISLTMDNLKSEFGKIQSQGRSKEIDFKVKNLNIEENNEKGWIPDDVWMKCDTPVTLADFEHRVTYAGLDLANTNDFNAFVLFAPAMTAGQKNLCLPFFWTTEDAIEKFRSKRPYVEHWAKDGYIRTTSGNVTDYETIRQEIKGICSNLKQLRAIGFDRALSAYLAPALVEDGFRMEVLVQSWQWLTPAGKHLEVMVAKQELAHGGHPVLRWNMANVVLQFDRNENYLPNKGKSADKIDGAAALLNAIAQYLKERDIPAPVTSYLLDDNRELLELDY
jgi:phage terminase large subunit-like protein